jgi:ABC-type glutathione transport system ATPase component
MLPAPVPTASTAPLLEVRDLTVHFPVRTGLLQRTTRVVRAVDGVSFDLAPGETLGIVGESGCGKTTLGRAVLRLVAATSGSVRFRGTDVLAASRAQLRGLRRQMQIIFQDPAGSLNPRLRIRTIVGEPLMVHGLARSSKDLRVQVDALLERVGMPASAADKYPHQFSGGQKQRIGIARALSLRPSFIVCDEPTSALDVSVQAQILNLLADLRDEFRLSYLFISHDMAVVNHLCDRVAVMQEGVIVESGPRQQVLHEPRHPYTRALLASVPEPVIA